MTDFLSSAQLRSIHSNEEGFDPPLLSVLDNPLRHIPILIDIPSRLPVSRGSGGNDVARSQLQELDLPRLSRVNEFVK
jgi:hypothetical protein